MEIAKPIIMKFIGGKVDFPQKPPINVQIVDKSMKREWCIFCNDYRTISPKC